jgi:tetratricopeptide (TPR) repeat protein
MYLLGRYSGLFPWEKARKRITWFSSFMLALYLVVWFAMRPSAPPPRIIVFPTSAQIAGEKLRLPEIIETYLKKDIQKEYSYHPAEWIVASADRDSMLLWDYQRKIVDRMEAEYGLLTSYDGEKWKWRLITESEKDPLAEGEAGDIVSLYADITGALENELGIKFIHRSLREEEIPPLRALELLWWERVDSNERVLKMYENADTTIQKNEIAMATYAHAIIWKAYQMKKEAERVKNPFKKSRQYLRWFRKGRNELIRIGRKNPNNLRVNLTLADAFILEEKYDLAEVALKNAFAEDPDNAEIYFLFSFLDPSRYRDLFFKGIRDVLEKALALDPMYEAAVIRYIRQIGEENVSQSRYFFDKSAEYAKAFLHIKPSSYLVWNELAGMYSTGKEYENALYAIGRALKVKPDDESVLFNAGIIYYRLDRLDEAFRYFSQAIEKYNTLDAYLYRGMIHFKKKEYKEAVLDFRYRIVHKRSDDDYYYIQAAKGLNKVIWELDKQGINIDDLVPPEKVN